MAALGLCFSLAVARGGATLHCGNRLLIVVASSVAEHRLQVPRLSSYPVACGIFLDRD